jgi:transcriptional regulator with XRE-family HTH domain
MARLFGEKLRLLRVQRGQTQVELAAALASIQQSHLANVEAGRDVASLDLIIRTARHFSVSLDYLLRDEMAIEAVASVSPAPTEQASPQPFGVKLRALRDARGWSQSDLARQLGLARRGYISNLEAGRKQPSVQLAVQIADLFGLPTDLLLREELSLTPRTALSPGMDP